MAEFAGFEEMSEFFNKRADTYEDHMLKDMDLKVFYDEIENCLPVGKEQVKVLDLGCGTGLELERLFKLYPEAEVTGIDLSENMLRILKNKFADKEGQLNLICKSYFDVDFGAEVFDLALSTYSLHHFTVESRLALYRNVAASLKQDGVYIEGDYTVKTVEEEKLHMAENERIRKENGVVDGIYHYDTPLAVQTQAELLRMAGFREVTIRKEWDSTTVFVCSK